MPKLAIIGYGNMGKAIADGLLLSGNFTKTDIVFGTDDASNIKAVKSAKTVILAVKPDVIPVVINVIKDHLTTDHLIISVAARVKINNIKKILGENNRSGSSNSRNSKKHIPVVRVMPNICAALRQSMSCWAKSREVTGARVKVVKFILNSIGKEIEIKDEKQFGLITMLAGSGPAFYFYLAELFEKFAQQNGLKPQDAEKIIKQTFLGSAMLFDKSDISAEQLRKNVTSKKGTTEAAIKVFKKYKFDKIFLKGLKAGHKRASL
ncbi:pyrroline-5-carboxylate reductase [Candidatus Peregrinibacteria bacterium]|nr:pyrroline-5-carboxylate reductase [Candidatus Peregrinibacteria bacterium]